MAYKTATYNIAWHTDNREFYHRVMASVSRQFGVRADSLNQVVHGPALTLHRGYSMRNPKAKTGDLIKVTVSFYHDPKGWPLEVTSFNIVEYTPPAPPQPSAPPRPRIIEWQITVFDLTGVGIAGLKVKLRLPDRSEGWYSTDWNGVVYLRDPVITSGKIDVLDLKDDRGTPEIRYGKLAEKTGLPTDGKHTLWVPDKRKVIENVMTAAGVNRRSSYGKLTPPYSKMETDWFYEIITLHHSGNSGEKDPADIEAMHMGPKKGYDDIGYHFMVDDNGKIFEGRYLAFKGSHVEMANSGKIGILVMGDFEHQWWDSDDDDPTTPQLNSVKSLIRVLKSNFSKITKLGGHKDYKAGTDCPGEELYDLIPGIRTDVGLGGP